MVSVPRSRGINSLDMLMVPAPWSYADVYKRHVQDGNSGPPSYAYSPTAWKKLIRVFVHVSLGIPSGCASMRDTITMFL